jgi:adenine/guanine/hypoxanthine permease
MHSRINSFFDLDKKGSSLNIEILAGISTFLSLSYIFVVNPAILSQAGMDKSVVLFATILVSALSTLTMGLWARLPFVLSPGMEMNAYVAFFVVGSLGFTWQQALGAVFWSGIIFVILSFSGIREKIIHAIPRRMKSGLSLSVGVFLGLIALKVAGVLRYDGLNIRGIGSLASPTAYALYTGIGIIIILERLRVRGAVLISIILSCIFCHYHGIESNEGHAAEFSVAMFSGIGKLDFGVIFNPRILNVILILFLIDFYGSVAKFIGLVLNTNIMTNGKLPRIREALSIDGLATIFGSLMGTTSITTYVESGVGIGAGGRTGLTAVVCGMLMLSCFLLLPLLKFVPVVATTGALLCVGLKLIPPLKELKTYLKVDIMVMVIMQIAVIATFAIDRAMLVGFMVYVLIDLFYRRRPNTYVVISTVLLTIGTVIQYV